MHNRRKEPKEATKGGSHSAKHTKRTATKKVVEENDKNMKPETHQKRKPSKKWQQPDDLLESDGSTDDRLLKRKAHRALPPVLIDDSIDDINIPNKSKASPSTSPNKAHNHEVRKRTNRSPERVKFREETNVNDEIDFKKSKRDDEIIRKSKSEKGEEENSHKKHGKIAKDDSKKAEDKVNNTGNDDNNEKTKRRLQRSKIIKAINEENKEDNQDSLLKQRRERKARNNEAPKPRTERIPRLQERSKSVRTKRVPPPPLEDTIDPDSPPKPTVERNSLRRTANNENNEDDKSKAPKRRAMTTKTRRNERNDQENDQKAKVIVFKDTFSESSELRREKYSVNKDPTEKESHKKSSSSKRRPLVERLGYNETSDDDKITIKQLSPSSQKQQQTTNEQQTKKTTMSKTALKLRNESKEKTQLKPIELKFSSETSSSKDEIIRNIAKNTPEQKEGQNIGLAKRDRLASKSTKVPPKRRAAPILSDSESDNLPPTKKDTRRKTLNPKLGMAVKMAFEENHNENVPAKKSTKPRKSMPGNNKKLESDSSDEIVLTKRKRLDNKKPITRNQPDNAPTKSSLETKEDIKEEKKKQSAENQETKTEKKSPPQASKTTRTTKPPVKIENSDSDSESNKANKKSTLPTKRSQTKVPTLVSDSDSETDEKKEIKAKETNRLPKQPFNRSEKDNTKTTARKETKIQNVKESTRLLPENKSEPKKPELKPETKEVESKKPEIKESEKPVPKKLQNNAFLANLNNIVAGQAAGAPMPLKKPSKPTNNYENEYGNDYNKPANPIPSKSNPTEVNCAPENNSANPPKNKFQEHLNRVKYLMEGGPRPQDLGSLDVGDFQKSAQTVSQPSAPVNQETYDAPPPAIVRRARNTGRRPPTIPKI